MNRTNSDSPEWWFLPALLTASLWLGGLAVAFWYEAHSIVGFLGCAYIVTYAFWKAWRHGR